MYATQRHYLSDTPFRTYFQKIRWYIAGMLDSFQRGLKAAKLAEKDPADKEAIMRILSEK